MPFIIVQKDITAIKADVIVNAANTDLKMGGGVCGAIFRAAGASELQTACNKLAPIQTGEAVITPGFRLPAKYVIHTAGPVYYDGKHGENGMLRSCYLNSLICAVENKCKSIAFPLISSGIYGYPKEEALRVAKDAIQAFLLKHDLDVFLAVIDKTSFTVNKKMLGDVDNYIDKHYVDTHRDDQCGPIVIVTKISELKAPVKTYGEITVPKTGLADLIGNLDEPFSATLLKLIEAKGRTDVEVYKRANLDRKLFSKIRTGKGYMPSKRTAVALAVALELTLEETEDLLGRAGYTLSHSHKFDVIVEYFIMNGKYDIFEINQVLFKYDQPLLGS